MSIPTLRGEPMTEIGSAVLIEHRRRLLAIIHTAG
ncbi:hypothetical protein FB558_3624 [Pseudonocardia kunmingensis]|uniref:Uncharacterized protein n=1 Tax=Pseudonocardia kunmingensis TaxID=630975 RepID=A0A543DP21_9PSEU|nr:hypothetical protein FB558_3624 [Pseudonocardia kunmingensis]